MEIGGEEEGILDDEISNSIYTICVADLPMIKTEYLPRCAVDEDFLRYLFKDYGVCNYPDSVILRTKTSSNGNPYSYAFVRFDTREHAIKARADLNYTKLDGVPIRLILADKETRNIIRNNQTRLIIKNLDPGIEESQLYDAFEKFGEIIDCKIPADIVHKDGEIKIISRGYGYVTFRNQEDAKQAMNDLKDASINGRPIEIQLLHILRGQDPERTFHHCYIKNFPESFTDEEIKALFGIYGTPLFSKVMRDEHGKSKRFGFCSMSTYKGAVRAIEELNELELNGVKISCGRVLTKNERFIEFEKQPESRKREFYENNYVCNFDDSLSDEEFIKLFNPEFVYFRVNKDGKEENCLEKSSSISFHDNQADISLEQRMRDNMQNEPFAAANDQNTIPMYFQMMPNPQPQPNIPYYPIQNPPMQPYNFLPQPFYPMQYRAPGYNTMLQSFGFGYQAVPFLNQDIKSMLRSEILENHSSKSNVLLQRLRDMSDEQAKTLANNQELFLKWVNL